MTASVASTASSRMEVQPAKAEFREAPLPIAESVCTVWKETKQMYRKVIALRDEHDAVGTTVDNSILNQLLDRATQIWNNCDPIENSLQRIVIEFSPSMKMLLEKRERDECERQISRAKRNLAETE